MTGASMKRSPMRRTKGINRQSSKGKQNREDWKKRRDEKLRVSPSCEGKGVIEGECWGWLTVHHKMPRSMGGTQHDDSPLVTLCIRHHDWVESHREWAKENGWLLRKT